MRYYRLLLLAPLLSACLDIGSPGAEPTVGNADEPAPAVRVVDAPALAFVDDARYLGDYADAEARAYRNGTLDPVALSVPETLVQAARQDPGGGLQALVDHLLAGATDDLQRAKRLHDWIASAIDYDAEGFLAGDIGPQAATDVLRTGQAVCDGFAALFLRMAQLGGLTARTIEGKLKGYTLNHTGVPGRHTWNAVAAHGRWYLLDVTSDAGVLADGSFRRRYTTAYLFLAPAWAIYSHLPDDPAHQLLSKPLSMAEFLAQPRLEIPFFDHDLRPQQDLAGQLPADDALRLTFDCPADLLLKAVMQPASGGGSAEHCALAHRVGGQCVVELAGPAPGIQTVRLYAARPSGDTGLTDFQPLLTLRVKFDRACDSPRPLPFATDDLLARRATLVSPLVGVLERGSRQTFDLTVPGADALALVTLPSQHQTIIQADAGGRAVGEVTIDAGTESLVVQSSTGGQWVYLLEYAVRP